MFNPAGQSFLLHCQSFEKSISLIIDKYIGGMSPSRKHTHDTFVETLFVTDI